MTNSTCSSLACCLGEILVQCRNHSSHPMHATHIWLLSPSSSHSPLHTGRTVLSDMCAAFCSEILVVCFLCFALAFFAAFCCFSSHFASLAAFLSSRNCTISSPDRCVGSCAIPLVVFFACCRSGIFSTSSSSRPLLHDGRLHVDVSA